MKDIFKFKNAVDLYKEMERRSDIAVEQRYQYLLMLEAKYFGLNPPKNKYKLRKEFDKP